MTTYSSPTLNNHSLFLIEIYSYTCYVASHQVVQFFFLVDKVFFHLISHLIASFEAVSVIGHGDQNITKWHDLLKSLSLVYSSDRQAPLNLMNLLKDSDRWQIQADG